MATTPEYLQQHEDSVESVAMNAQKATDWQGVAVTHDEEADKRIEEANRPDAITTALSFYRHETILGNMFAGYKMYVKDGDIKEWDESFNPYAYYAQNKQDYSNLEHYVRKGGFDHIYSPTQFDALAAQLRKENEDIKNMESGSTAGMFLGMGLSLVDLASLVPMAKPVTGMKSAYNAGRVAAAGMAIQGAQEMYLHGTENQRTFQESALNTALAGVFGAGIGIWGTTKHPAIRENFTKALDENLDHPLVAIAPGQGIAEAEHVGSVGAARYSSEDTKLAGGGTRLGNFIRAATPVGRAFQWTSGAARDAMQGMLDLGGSLTEGMSKGLSGGFAAEDLAQDYMHGFNRSVSAVTNDLASLNMELGASGSKTRQAIQSDILALTGGKYRGIPIDNKTYSEIVQRKLTNEVWQTTGGFKGVNGDTDIDAQWLRETLDRFGYSDEVYQAVDKWTSKTAKEIQQGQLELEELLVSKGMLPEEKRLGKGYGLAQLWNAEGIIENPDKARSFFMSILSENPSEQYLADNFGMSIEDFRKIPLTDPKRGQILTEWTGEAEQLELAQAQTKFDEAFKRAAETQKNAQAEAEILGILQKESKKTNIKAIRAASRRAEAGLHLKRLERMQEMANDASASLDELNAKLEHHTGIAEGSTGDRGPLGELLDEIGPEVSDAKLNVKGKRAEFGANGRLKKVAEDAGSERAVAGLTRQREALLEELEAHKAELASAVEQFKGTAKGMKLHQRWIDASIKSVEDLKTRIGRAEGKQAIDELTATITERYGKLNAVMEEAVKADAEMRFAKNAMRSSSRLASRAAAQHTQELVKAGKTVRKLSGRTPMADYVDELVTTLSSHEKIPLSQLRDHVGDSGRVKDRMLYMTTEQRREAEGAGLLHKDLTYVLERQYKDLSGRMALMDKFGEVDLKNTIKGIKTDYEHLIRNAASPELEQKLKDELKDVLKDVDGVRDRILGRNMIQDDPESLVTWGVGKLRQMTFLRFVGGLAVGSLGDIASHVLHGSLGVQSFGMAKEAFRLLTDAGLSTSSREILAMVEATEMTMAHSTAGKMYGVDDLFHKQGVGTGLTKKITGRIDQVTNFIASRANTYAGMTGWNGMGKAVAGLTQMAELAHELPKWASLSSSRKAQLASLGIGEQEAQQLSKFMKKHGEWHGNLFDPNAHNWHSEAGGIEAHKVLRMSIRKLMDRAVLTPGIGDVPLVMNSTLGKLFFQFQSMGFAFNNRFMTPAAQRLFLHGDMKVISSFGALFAMAALSETLKSYIRGEDITKMDSQKFTRSVLDRSGILGYMSPYVNTGLKLAGMDGANRYSANTAWETFLGPWAGTLKTGVGAASDLSQGDIEKAAKKAYLLAPFNQFSRLASHLYDDATQ